MFFTEPFIEGANKSKAKLAQEFALAERIATSEVVEIEEYYDTNAEGNAGLKKGFFGFGGSGKRISKRVFRFQGSKVKNLE
jgi:hypothetical protein